MNGLISEKLEGVDLSEEFKIDGELSADEIGLDLVQDLEKLRPFGEGNTEPIFVVRGLKVMEKRNIGTGNKHIKLFLSPKDGSPKIFEALSFNGYDKYIGVCEGDQINIACNVQKDEWNGNKKIQLVLIDLKVMENKD